MNEATKNLMTHVERIVRPLRAMQIRKLRMRRELLNHLQSALDEERAGGLDEIEAIERAKTRLGDPGALRENLQRTVPWLERMLMARVPGSALLDRPEAQFNRFWGITRRMTMLHTAILVLGTSALSYAALLVVVLRVPRSGILPILERPLIWAVADLVVLVTYFWLLTVSGEIASAAALSKHPFRGLFRRAFKVLVLMLIEMFLFLDVMTSRALTTPRDVAMTLISATALVAALLLIGGLIRKLDRRYTPWQTLEIAG